MPLQKAKKSLALPPQFDEMLQPQKNQRPLYLPSPYAMENFGAFLEAVTWSGLEYGAIQLKVPTLEEDGSWWPRTKGGTVRKTSEYVFEGRLQNLKRRDQQDSGIYALNWTPIPKGQAIKMAGFFRWAEYLLSEQTWNETDSKKLWALENAGQAKPNKLYGVDGDGKCSCFLSFFLE
jgi:hypothetical protein